MCILPDMLQVHVLLSVHHQCLCKECVVCCSLHLYVYTIHAAFTFVFPCAFCCKCGIVNNVPHLVSDICLADFRILPDVTGLM